MEERINQIVRNKSKGTQLNLQQRPGQIKRKSNLGESFLMNLFNLELEFRCPLPYKNVPDGWNDSGCPNKHGTFLLSLL